MRKLFCLLFIFILAGSHSFTKAEEKKDGISFKLKGFLKTDMFYDTRQNVNYREGHFLLYPAKIQADKMGNDTNAASLFNMLSVQSRVALSMTGTKIFDASATGYMEAEFFGTSDININTLRLRHAYIKLDWEKTSIMIGQYWHPMFIADCYPGVISFNTGAPFQPFSRNPQIRFNQALGPVNIGLTAYTQRDFTSGGPNGFSGEYMRNNAVPGLDLLASFRGTSYLAGIGVDYKSLKPRLSTTKNIITDEKIQSLAVHAFAKFDADPFTIKLQGVYGQNLADLLMLGGYAVSSTDTSTGMEKYINFNNFTLWSEISFGKVIEGAVFAGFAKNLGSAENATGAIYGRGYDIDMAFRISPRVAFNAENVKFSLEGEYTSASYGTVDKSDKNKVVNSRQVGVLRLLLGVFYFF